MEIQSAFSSGLQGFQKAKGDANQAAASIAANLSISPEDFGVGQESNSATISQNTVSGDLSNLNQSIVDLKVAEFQAKASANVIKTADAMLGTLLDVSA
ncbi:MAG: hypothetical protein HRT53_10510 [Colwellia sp.]|nr:hypothetical protein [Colwellia sp.]